MVDGLSSIFLLKSGINYTDLSAREYGRSGRFSIADSNVCLELKWFGAPTPVGFTSRYDHWRYAETPKLPQTDAVLAGLIDMRLPLTFSLEECAMIARIIRDEAKLA